MRFSTEHAHAILAGAKTQHRVLVTTRRHRPGDTHAIQRPRHVDEMTALERVRFEEGDGRRGHTTIGYLRVAGVDLQPLGQLGYDQARAEGHRDRAAFARHWMEFPTDDTSGDEDVLELFDELHADTLVWVLTVTPDTRDAPRLLAARSQDGYVASPARALADEPEAVDRATQQWITGQAGMTSEQWRALEKGEREKQLREMNIDDRMAVARRLAKTRNVDIERQLWLVERLRQEGRSDEAVLHKLRGAEDKIHRSAA